MTTFKDIFEKVDLVTSTNGLIIFLLLFAAVIMFLLSLFVWLVLK